VTSNFVSSIERGARGLDAYRLWAVADALGTTLDWLLAGPDDSLTTPTPGRSGAGAVGQASGDPLDEVST
jgi:transcriptional regulator with XRE-family HTH domain